MPLSARTRPVYFSDAPDPSRPASARARLNRFPVERRAGDAMRFVKIGSDFREELVRRDPDGRGKPEFPEDAGGDPPGRSQRRTEQFFSAGHVEKGLIDRDLFDYGGKPFENGHHFLRIAHIRVHARPDKYRRPDTVAPPRRSALPNVHRTRALRSWPRKRRRACPGARPR